MPEHHSAAIIVRLADPPPPWYLADLKPFRPYVYKGCGYDIFNPDEEYGEDDTPWSAGMGQP